MKPGDTKSTLKAHTRRLLVERTDNTLVQFIRYGFVAVAAFAFDFGTYAMLLGIGVHPVLAATLGFTLGLIVNYLLSILWVFTQRSRSRRFEIITFFATGLIGLGLTDLIIWALAVQMGQNALIAKLIATAVVFFWNFGARKVILFKGAAHRLEEKTNA